MKAYLTKTPRIITKFLSKYTWHFNRDKKIIYLTFDDGPTPDVTNFVLNTLKNHNAKATFFCIGKNIKNHPEIFQNIINEGHSIGNHTQNHLNGWKNTCETYVTNVLLCDKEIAKQNYSTKLFRPPYGKIKSSQTKSLIKQSYKIILWDVLSADFDTEITKEKCFNNVLENTKNGSIIVFHDSLKASDKLLYTLPKILKHYSKKGYEFHSINPH